MRAVLAVLAVLALAGCLSAGDVQPRTYFVLDDLASAATPDPRGIDRVLLVSAVSASPFYDSTSLAYSRAPGSRAYYQFASWTERPGQRIARLVEARLASRGAFRAVAQTTAGVKGDLLLNVSLDHLYHDDRAGPGLARIEATAELVDWRQRTLVARRTFVATAPLAAETAAEAAAAFNQAVTRLLDELVPWIEQTAARHAGRG